MSSRVLVIGAGIAGLSAANALETTGSSPVIVDKSRGVGGRLATRRSEFGFFNHGAPTVSAHTSGFKAFLTEADTAQWNGFGEAEGDPTMSALAKPLMGQIPLHLQLAVTHLESLSSGVKASFSDGESEEYERAIVAVPAPQAIQILSAEGVLASWAHALNDIKMDPCWTGLFAFKQPLPVLSIPRGVHLQNSSSLKTDQQMERWVFHSDAEWSREHLEKGKEEILQEITTLFFNGLQIDRREPEFAQAHRWRYARVAQSLKLPFLQSPNGRISVIGDAFSGPDGSWQDAEAAFHSGQSVARMPVDSFT